MCTPLALATDSLILLVSFCPWMPVHPWMFWICIIVLLYWLVYCIYPTVYDEYWLFPFSSPPCLLVLILYCLALYWLVLLLLHIPLSLQWVPVSLFSSSTCLLVFVFLLQEGRSIWVFTLYIITCILTLTFIVVNLLASTIVEGSRPCPHPYNIF